MAAAHSLRLLLVVLIVPALFTWGLPTVAAPPAAPVSWPWLAVLLPAGGLLALLWKRLGQPNPSMLGPLTVCALASVAFDLHIGLPGWAGALGQPQFMPSSYLKYAVDFDGDGHRDIWNSVPDALASIANYLSQRGWQRNRDWGFEVSIPANVSCAQEGPDLARPVADWAKMGITRISGKAFPANDLSADGMMLVPAGRHGPEFVVTPNFYVIKEYNNSDLYALFIGNLADRIAHGAGPFQGEWGNVGSMLRSDVLAMQKALVAKGYDVGKADGLAAVSYTHLTLPTKRIV